MLARCKILIFAAFLTLVGFGCATAPRPAADVAPAQKPSAATGPKTIKLPEGHPPLKNHFPHAFRNPQAEAYASYMYGLMLADEGKSTDAIGYLQMASRLDSRSPEILDELMRLHAGQGHKAQVQQIALRILKIDPKWVDAHVLLGQIYLDSKQPDKALNHFQTALELDPGKTEFIFLVADALEAKGDTEQAIAKLRELTGSEAHAPLAYFYIARIRLHSGDVAGSLDELAKAIELDPSFVKGVGELGADLEKQGKTRDAEQFYEKYLERDPGNNTVREFLARLFLKEGKYKEAGQQAGKILDAEPDNQGALLIMGLIAVHDGQNEKALGIFSKFRTSDPGNFELALQVGVLQRKLERYDQAIATFQEAARLSPDRYESYLNLAVVYEKTDELEKAIENARKALNLDPGRDAVRTFLAQLLVRTDRFGQAEDVLNQGLEKKPDDPDILYQLAIAYDRGGKFDSAVDTLKKIIQVDPKHYDAMNYLGYSWADRGINLDEALSLIKRALEIKPDAGYILDSLGWVYYRMGLYDKALEQLLKARKDMGEDATVLEHIGDTYDKLGQEGLAAEYWSRALKANPGNTTLQEKLRGKGAVEKAP